MPKSSSSRSYKLLRKEMEGEYGYWIDHSRLDGYLGPYETKGQAEDDAVGIDRFFREHDKEQVREGRNTSQ